MSLLTFNVIENLYMFFIELIQFHKYSYVFLQTSNWFWWHYPTLYRMHTFTFAEHQGNFPYWKLSMSSLHDIHFNSNKSVSIIIQIISFQILEICRWSCHHNPCKFQHEFSQSVCSQGQSSSSLFAIHHEYLWRHQWFGNEGFPESY